MAISSGYHGQGERVLQFNALINYLNQQKHHQETHQLEQGFPKNIIYQHINAGTYSG